MRDEIGQWIRGIRSKVGNCGGNRHSLQVIKRMRQEDRRPVEREQRKYTHRPYVPHSLGHLLDIYLQLCFISAGGIKF